MDEAIKPITPPLLPEHFDLMVRAYQDGYSRGAGWPAPTMDEDIAAIIAIVRAEARRQNWNRE